MPGMVGMHMLKRSADLFRRARERRKQSERLSEPTIFRQLSGRWDSAKRQAPHAEAAPRTTSASGLPLYWQKANRRADDFSRTDE
jgi:hypothetical protein